MPPVLAHAAHFEQAIVQENPVPDNDIVRKVPVGRRDLPGLYRLLRGDDHLLALRQKQWRLKPAHADLGAPQVYENRYRRARLLGRAPDQGYRLQVILTEAV